MLGRAAESTLLSVAVGAACYRFCRRHNVGVAACQCRVATPAERMYHDQSININSQLLYFVDIRVSVPPSSLVPSYRRVALGRRRPAKRAAAAPPARRAAAMLPALARRRARAAAVPARSPRAVHAAA